MLRIHMTFFWGVKRIINAIVLIYRSVSTYLYLEEICFIGMVDSHPGPISPRRLANGLTNNSFNFPILWSGMKNNCFKSNNDLTPKPTFMFTQCLHEIHTNTRYYEIDGPERIDSARAYIITLPIYVNKKNYVLSYQHVIPQGYFIQTLVSIKISNYILFLFFLIRLININIKFTSYVFKLNFEN